MPRRPAPDNGDVQHRTTVTLPTGHLADYASAVSELFQRNVPYNATITQTSSGLAGGDQLTAVWETTPVPDAPESRGRALVRRLRSGTVALVRLRRG